MAAGPSSRSRTTASSPRRSRSPPATPSRSRTRAATTRGPPRTSIRRTRTTRLRLEEAAPARGIVLVHLHEDRQLGVPQSPRAGRDGDDRRRIGTSPGIDWADPATREVFGVRREAFRCTRRWGSWARLASGLPLVGLQRLDASALAGRPRSLSVFYWSESRVLPTSQARPARPFALAASCSRPVSGSRSTGWPVQVSSTSRRSWTSPRSRPPRRRSLRRQLYLGRPALLFSPGVSSAKLLGGIDLYHMRLLHALVGLLTIAACYALFRQLLPRGWALFATASSRREPLVFMISRLAMRENTAVLVEVVAFALLLWGLRQRPSLRDVLGRRRRRPRLLRLLPGRARSRSGLSSSSCSAFFGSRFRCGGSCRPGAIALAGFVLMAAPIVIAE